MNNVALTIGGREFLVGCAPGEEAHIRDLGQVIESKIIAAGVHGLSEARMLLFAALLLADENHELTRSAARASPATSDQDTQDTGDTARALAEIATRMEKLAQLLETPLESGPEDL